MTAATAAGASPLPLWCYHLRCNREGAMMVPLLLPPRRRRDVIADVIPGITAVTAAAPLLPL